MFLQGLAQSMCPFFCCEFFDIQNAFISYVIFLHAVERREKLHLQSEIDFDDYDAQVFTYSTPRSALRNRITRSLYARRKGDLGPTRKSSPDVLGVRGKLDNKPQGSWNENQQESSQLPLVRAVSESEDIRLGSSFGENMIFVGGKLKLLFQKDQITFSHHWRIGQLLSLPRPTSIPP